MRIVLVSSGAGARHLAQELSRHDDVSILHAGEEGRDELEKLDVEVLAGEGNDADALKRAGADHADYLVACTRSDEMNLLACLTARQLGAAKTICYVSREEYTRTFAARDGGTGGAPTFGVDHLVWPARMLADKIERILTVPGAVDAGRFAQGRVELLEYRLRAHVPLVGRPLAAIGSLPPGVLMAGVRRGEEWFVPRGQSVLEAGDRVLFMGRSEAMHELAAWFAEYLGEEELHYVVIVGGGMVGLRLARSLEKNPKARLKLIERSAERCTEIARVLERTLVLHGDGCDLDLLEDEGVRHAQALVAVTDSDEKNLLASLLARQLGVPRIVTRVSSAANRRLFERVGIDVPLSARAEADEAVLHLIRHGEADLIATIGEGAGEVLEITLPAKFTPTPLKEVPLPPDSLVAAVVRKSEVIVPGGATLLGPSDHCFVICKVERVAGVLRALLG